MELTAKQNTTENAVELRQTKSRTYLTIDQITLSGRLVPAEQKGWRAQTLQSDSYKAESNEMISYLCKAFMAMTIHLYRVKIE